MKQLIILVCYLNVDNLSELHVRSHLAELNNVFEQAFNQELQDKTNTTIKTIVLPIENQNSYVKCIYPDDSSEEILVRINELIERNAKAFNL